MVACRLFRTTHVGKLGKLDEPNTSMHDANVYTFMNRKKKKIHEGKDDSSLKFGNI